MSLINRLAQESIKQNKLISQLSEISYRAINGKRQNARNFNEGTLNVGTMNFNTAPDKITKDMYLDYQKAEQAKHYNDGTNKFEYDPTGLFDPMKKKKKINVLVKECFRAVLLKPVEGMRNRWAG